MDCREAQEKIMPFIHEELPDEHLETFMEHMDSCNECKEELEISYSIFWGLRMLQDDAVDSFHIQHSLEEFLKKTRERIVKHHRRQKFILGLFVGFLFVVALFFGIQLLRMMRPEWIAFFAFLDCFMF